MSKYNLKDIYEGMSDKDYNAAKEAERLEKHPEKDKIKAVQAMMAKEKSSKNESEVEEVSSKVGSRIEGLLNIEMKNKFLNAGMDLIQDVLEDDEFFIEDIVDHLAIELNKYYDERASLGSKINDLEEEKSEDIEESEEISELAGTESVDALTALIGAGGLVGGAVALDKLMTALEAGKLGSKGEAVAKFLRSAGKTFSGGGLKEADSIVDEHEFNFFQTILDGRYKEEDIEEYLKSDDYQQALETLNLDASDTKEWIGEFANYFGDGADAYIDEISKEDKELKEHFSRFLKDYN